MNPAASSETSTAKSASMSCAALDSKSRFVDAESCAASVLEARDGPPLLRGQRARNTSPSHDPNRCEDRWWLTVDIGGRKVRSLYDPGAACTVMSSLGERIAAECNRKIRPSNGREVRVADGRQSSITGYVDLPFEVAGIKKDVTVAVLPNLDHDCYVGVNFCRLFGAVHDATENLLYLKRDKRSVQLEVAGVDTTRPVGLGGVGLARVTPRQREQLQKIVDEMLGVDDTALGCTSLIEHEIDVGSARPVKQRYYPVSKKIEEEMHRQVREMLDAGIIEPATSGWSSPVVMVRKANGKYRFCVDFRKVNALSTPNAYPLRKMDDIQRKLQNARYITTIDLSSAYHQIPLTKESRPITAFTVPNMGLFQFTRMPYGLAYAPATFQLLMDKVISPDLEGFAYSYLDDVIIVTETFEEHMKYLRIVLNRIKDAGLTINKEKSVFGREEVKYLGFLVNHDGCRPDPQKTAPVREYPAPSNLKQLRRFLGMASWYRKFLPNFATTAEPLTRLTKKGRKYEWAEEQQQAYEAIKELLATAPVLHRPHPEAQFIVQTDASDTGLGAVLLQKVDGDERVLEYASRTMVAAERNYTVTERECLAVIWAVRKG